MLVCVCRAQSRTPLQLKPQSTADLWQTSFKALLVAVLCLGVLAACLYGWRAWKQRKGAVLGAPASLQLESARRISQKTTLLTVQWQGRRYLLAESASTTSVIDSRALDGGSE
jgi:hypothetical protein